MAASVGRVLAVCSWRLAAVLDPQSDPVALAAFIYFAGRAEEAQVLHEDASVDRRRAGQGIWTAPPGYRWVSRGNGTWQLAPMTVGVRRSTGRPASPWL